MIKLAFNEDWRYRRIDVEDEYKEVTLPHDAMLCEKRIANSAGGTNTGWFEAHDYEYIKEYDFPENSSYLEFEGVYHNAEAYVDGEKTPAHPNGYFGFKVPVSSGRHIIRIIARNLKQPSSRWYSGSGIYRPVYLVCQPEKYIIPESISIKTLDYHSKKISINFKSSDSGNVRAEILDGENVMAVKESCGIMTFELPEASLWSPDNPKLYTCRLTRHDDVHDIRFGIRKVEVDSKKGFQINGERIILLGACIHHDNGILGAAGHPFAERRKIEILKKAGYNAIRSAHNPVSVSILNACDELGMLVLDEYVDMWYTHKTKYDYAVYFENNWRNDLRLLVEKDRNHPSVIMYSIGNEVSETAQKKGIELTGQMRDYLSSLDDRPVTCGINIFFNYLSSIGFGVYSDSKAESDAKKAEKAGGKAKKKAVGSEFINNVAGLMGAGFMKFGATLRGSNMKTRDAFGKLDVAGYNYGVNRYKRDLKKYPERVILGSETFCSDAAYFYKLAKKHPALIGDFVWTGIDYLGEVGLGAWEYREYAPDFEHGPGWITAGAGSIDLIGNETSQMAYTQVAFEKSKIRIGVIPVIFGGESHSPAAWRMTNAIESWSWNGCDGKKATVEVYSSGYITELILNGKSLGKKKTGKNMRTRFTVTYYPGELVAVSYDENGKEVARTSLCSAGEETILNLSPEKSVISADDLLYVKMAYTDKNGTVKPAVRGDIKLEVKGGTLIAAGNACSYNEKGYLTDTTDTYYGEALAVIKPSESCYVEIQADSAIGHASARIQIK